MPSHYATVAVNIALSDNQASQFTIDFVDQSAVTTTIAIGNAADLQLLIDSAQRALNRALAANQAAPPVTPTPLP